MRIDSISCSICLLLLVLIEISCAPVASKEVEIPSNSSRILPLKDSRKIDPETTEIFLDANYDTTAHKTLKDQLGDLDPNTFVELKYLNGQFYLYDSCDGGFVAYKVSQDQIKSYGIHEDIDFQIVNQKKTDLNMVFELTTDGYSGPITMSITRTPVDLVDKIITLKNGVATISYATAATNINKFYAIINQCPTTKVSEFEGFTNPNF